MATAKQLLDGLNISNDSKVLIIDNDLRTIYIPESITTLGVEFDGNVHRLEFQMPRMYGVTDLSTFNIRINYMNANEEGDIYVITDKKVRESSITFTWLVGPHALAYKGDVKFIVCLKESNSDGDILREFNTTVATLPVLEGLEVDASPLESELSDVIEQLLSLTVAKVAEVEAEGSAQIAKVQAKSVAEQNNIVEKGKEVLATIPEDYQTTTKLANEGVRTKADAIICSTEGDTIVVRDASDDYIRGLRIFGKTRQITTTGKNLLDDSKFVETNSQGVRVTRNNDGSFSASGIANTGYVSLVRLGQIELTAGVRYIITGSVPHMRLTLRDETSGTVYIDDNGEGASYVPSEDMTAYLNIRVENGETIDATFYPMIRLATVDDSSYEPYTGGIPAPNPDYPQELMSIGDGGYMNVAITGKNILNPNALDVSSNTSLTVSNDGYTIIAKGGTTSGWSSSIYVLPTELTLNLRGKRIYISCDSFVSEREGTGTRAGFNVTLENGDTIYPVSAGPSNLSVSTVVPKDATKMLFGIYSNNSGTVLDVDNTVTVKGLRVSVLEYTDWVQYYPVQMPSFNHSIPGVPVSSGGNYTDKNGQQWVCDEIDFERGLYVQRIGTYSVTGNESWIISRQQPAVNGYTRFDGAALQNIPPASNDTMCTHAPWTGNTNPKYGPAAWVNDSGNNTLQIRIMTTHTSVEEFVEFAVAEHANGTPIRYCYPLKTPVETTLTADEITAFKVLKTNYPSTTIMNDSGAWMNVRYNADTETWIKNLIDEKISAAISNL